MPINKTSRILVSSRDMITKRCYFPVLPPSPQVGGTLLCCIIASMCCREGFIVCIDDFEVGFLVVRVSAS